MLILILLVVLALAAVAGVAGVVVGLVSRRRYRVRLATIEAWMARAVHPSRRMARRARVRVAKEARRERRRAARGW